MSFQLLWLVCGLLVWVNQRTRKFSVEHQEAEFHYANLVSKTLFISPKKTLQLIVICFVLFLLTTSVGLEKKTRKDQETKHNIS